MPLQTNINISLLYNIDSEYLAIDSSFRNYLHPTSKDLDSCQKIFLNLTQKIHICKLRNPIYHTKNCATSLFTHQSHNKEICSYKRIKPLSNSIVRLNNPNSWLLIIFKSLSLLLNCPKDKNIITFNSSSILTHSEECVVSNSDFTLPKSKTQTKINFKLQHPPQIEVGKEILFNIVTSRSELGEKLKILDYQKYQSKVLEISSEMEQFQQKLESLSQDRKRTHDKFNNHSNHLLLSTGLSMTLFIILSLLIIGTNFYTKKQLQSTTNPKDKITPSTLITVNTVPKSEPSNTKTIDHSNTLENPHKPTHSKLTQHG